MNRSEKTIFLKFAGLTASLFVTAIVIQFGFLVEHPEPYLFVLPLFVGVIISSLIGFNAVLRSRLQDSNDAKSRFLSRMSHELRTPLNAILGFAQLSRFSALENKDEQQLSNTDEILVAGNHLLDLISELLDVSRIEAGSLTLDLNEVNLGETLEQCLSIISSLAEESGIEIKVDKRCNDSQLMVMADRTRLREILINLLSNAVKYNNPSGQVEIICEEVGNSKIRVSVIDTGCGIASEEIDRIFHPFVRVGREQDSIEGVGIGLGITKSLVELMDGSMGCKSVVDEGSTFWVELQKSDSSERLPG